MKKQKQTIAALAMSLLLFGASSLVSCNKSENDAVVSAEAKNAVQMENFSRAVSSLSKPENFKNANSTSKEAVDKTTDLLLSQSKDLLLANGRTEKELATMTSSKIISTALAVYAEECQKQQSLKN
jgi:hypothetical protein